MQRGYFGIGIYEPKYEENIGTLWRHGLIYGAHFIFTVGNHYQHEPGDTAKTPRHLPLWRFRDMEDMRTHLPENCEVVAVEMKDTETIPLDEFKHPERAVYLLGGESHGLPEEVLKNTKTIHIPTPKSISLNVAATGTLVLYDRYIKTRRAASDE